MVILRLACNSCLLSSITGFTEKAFRLTDEAGDSRAVRLLGNVCPANNGADSCHAEPHQAAVWRVLELCPGGGRLSSHPAGLFSIARRNVPFSPFPGY